MSLVRPRRPAAATAGWRSTDTTVRRKPIIVALAGVLLTVVSVACGAPAQSESAQGQSSQGQSSQGESLYAPPAAETSSAAVPPAPPPVPQPAADGPCRYLSAAAVQAANGERVAGVRISRTGPQQPHPACFFLIGNGTVQLRTWIVVATPAVAGATVDAAAPVASSDLVKLPGGWSGGSQPTADGAVFAVARRGTAVVIMTNQRQTISARQIAEQVIAALRL